MTIQENIPLSAHTTLHIGGVARYFVEAQSIEEVKAAAHFALQNALPLLVLGGGSNLLVSDEGFAGVVLKNAITGLEFFEEENTLRIVGGAGLVFDEVIAAIVVRGGVGLENLSAIPGTLGATPVQNVGAYGVEVGEMIASVRAVSLESGEEKIFTHDECQFSYRDSFFKTVSGKKFCITHVTLCVQKNGTPKIMYADLQKFFGDTSPTVAQVREAVIKIRAQKFPDWHQVGTAGSFFKNPVISLDQYRELLREYPLLPQYAAGPDMVKIPLGYVLDKLCGLKGYRTGRVGLYEEQALVLVNHGGATAAEVKEFVAFVSEKVFTKTKIKIFPEVVFV